MASRATAHSYRSADVGGKTADHVSVGSRPGDLHGAEAGLRRSTSLTHRLDHRAAVMRMASLRERLVSAITRHAAVRR